MAFEVDYDVVVASKCTNSMANDGEPTASAGLLGRGKSMSSWSTLGSESSIVGNTRAGDCKANDSFLK